MQQETQLCLMILHVSDEQTGAYLIRLPPSVAARLKSTATGFLYKYRLCRAMLSCGSKQHKIRSLTNKIRGQFH